MSLRGCARLSFNATAASDQASVLTRSALTESGGVVCKKEQTVTMSRERDRFRKFPSGNEKRKKTEEFNASLRGSFDTFVTRITDPTGSQAAAGAGAPRRDKPK